MEKKKRGKRFNTRNKNTLTSQSKPRKKPVRNKLSNDDKVKNAQKVFYNNIQFKSNLEMYMYKLLEANGFMLDFDYEKHKIVLQETFKLDIPVYEKDRNKRYSLGLKTIRAITYTPDFIVYFKNTKKFFIVETKGLKTDAFTLKFKMLKNLVKNGFRLVIDNEIYELEEIHLPSNQEQCRTVLDMILYGRNKGESSVD